jgi:OOP family OmpA-OmpF porin
MKKILSTMVFSIATLAMCLPAMAIELSPDAMNVPSTYAKVANGTITYNDTTTAYCSDTFNAILGAYGLTLAPEGVAGVPTSYAKAANDKVMFNQTPIAYTPQDYHNIFTAYGLQLTPEDAATLAGVVTYCKVSDGKITFGNISTAYDSKELSTILAAYSLPMVETVVVVETDCVDSDGDGVCDEIDVCPGTPKGVQVDERGCWTLEQTYLFDFDKSEVKPVFYPMLDHIAKIMKDNPKMTIQLEGHTDSVGTDKYNQGLSERRANAVKKALIERTMADAERLKAIGYGESKPIMTNKTKEGRAKNRRVDLKPIW